jgi:hypothetical protein
MSIKLPKLDTKIKKTSNTSTSTRRYKAPSRSQLLKKYGNLKKRGRGTANVAAWVNTWRAAIRPFVVSCSLVALVIMYFTGEMRAENQDITNVLAFYVSSWMGSRPYEKG